MILKKLNCALLTSIFLGMLNLANAADIGHFIGNGGEGVLVRDKIYLRDLYEMGLTEQIYAGEAIDPELKNLVIPNIQALNVPQEKLLLKLSDLQKSYPHLGIYVAEVIKFYHWALVDMPLDQMPDDAPISTALKRVTIANRYWKTIRIQKSLWEKLPDDHKVALLIHEAFYSMNRFSCSEGEAFICTQSAKFTRDLVGSLFSPNTLGALPFSLPALRTNLLLPRRFDDDQVCSAYQEPNIEIKTLSGKTENLGLSPTLIENKGNRDGALSHYCETSSSDGPISIYLKLTRSPFVKVEKFYNETGGALQTAVQFFHRSGILSGKITFKSPDDCKAYLSRISDNWFDTRFGFSGRDYKCASGLPPKEQ